ncbi:MAG: hypothetical protein ISN29_04715 [Gammaproteobacteria bacterium AqS3]|nr:hypothetical protein [Gammaproteobacteria bacterium AqS3]
MFELLNRALAEVASTDPEGRAALAELDGVSLDLDCSGVHLGLRIAPGGILQLADFGTAEAQVSATPLGFLRALGGDSRSLLIEGEAERAQRLLEALKKLGPSWHLLLVRAIGDGPAGLIAGELRAREPQVRAAGAALAGWVRDAGVRDDEYAEFVRRTQDLQLSIDRLQARLDGRGP